MIHNLIDDQFLTQTLREKYCAFSRIITAIAWGPYSIETTIKMWYKLKTK